MSSANLFPDIPAGWLGLITGVGAAGAAFLRSIWNGKNDEIKRVQEEKKAEIEKREAVIDALRLRINDMQDKSIAALKDQLDQSAKRRETDERVARSMEEVVKVVTTATAKAVTP